MAPSLVRPSGEVVPIEPMDNYGLGIADLVLLISVLLISVLLVAKPGPSGSELPFDEQCQQLGVWRLRCRRR